MPNWGPVHPVELISARIDGEISKGEVQYLEAHLRSCPSCEQKEAELKAIVSELAGLEVPSAPAGTIARLLVGLAQRTEHKIVVATEPPTTELVPSNRPAPQASPNVPGVKTAIAAVVEAAVEVAAKADEPSPAFTTTLRFPWKALASAGAAGAVVVFLYSVGGGVRGDRAEAGGVSTPSAAIVATVPPEPQDLPKACIIADTAPAAASATQQPRPAPAERRQIIMTWKEAPVAASAPQVAAMPEPQHVEPVLEAPEPIVDEPPSDAMVDAGAVLAPISFSGSSKRLTREAKQRVAAVAELLRQQPDAELLIQGYADGRGSIEKNRALAERRAEAVARQIEKLGIDAKRLRPVLGEQAAAADEDRVEFVLTR